MRFLLCAKALYPSTAYNSFNYCTCVCQWLSVHCWRLFFIYITIREFKCKTTMPQLVIFKFARFLHSTNHSILLQSKNTSRIIKKKLNVQCYNKITTTMTSSVLTFEWNNIRYNQQTTTDQIVIMCYITIINFIFYWC